MLLKGLQQQLTAQSAIATLLATPTSVYLNVAKKGAPPAFLVLNLASGLPAGSTLDGISALNDGEIQLDSYAGDQASARELANTVRAYLTESFVGGTLPDGTTIQIVDVTADQDMPYELGGTGYLYRCMQRYQAFYNEGGGGFVPSGGSVTRYTLTPAPDGSNVNFETSPSAVVISASALLFRNGVKQSSGQYSASGEIITFVTAPDTGDVLELYQ